jgi:hypothetical protein
MAEHERRWLYRLVSLLLLLAGGAALCVCITFAQGGYRFWQLQRRGVHVNAQLTGKDTVHQARGGTAYRIRYRFATADGRVWSGTGTVTWADLSDWQAATETAEVAYLAEDPAVNAWVVGLSDPPVASLAGSVVLGLGACLLLGLAVKAARSPEAFRRWWAENARR